MELSWLMKLRIAAAAATGVVLIGILVWPIATPSELVGVVRADTISVGSRATLVILALLAGFIAYFVSWPYGREIGILAVPSGLSIWALRSGSMATLMQLKPTIAQRQAFLSTLKWEPIFWLVIVTAGFLGVLLGQKIRPSLNLKETQEKANSKSGKYLNAIIALVGSGLIAQFCIRIFAQDIRMFDNKLGSVVAQPAVGQIVFAVLVSFGLAAFVVKKFLDASYIWPAIAGALVTAFAISTYVGQLPYLVQRWPAAFFSNAIVSILPVQMVAFGTLGSIAGYWMAIRYRYWRKHEMK
ncbi:MAG: hypothetical protein ACYTFW_12745 [Planctomycetota bacterium]|jgi:hypothetical protein